MSTAPRSVPGSLAPIFILIFSLSWSNSFFSHCFSSAIVYSLGLDVSDQVRAGTVWGRGTAQYALCEGGGCQQLMHENDWHFSDTQALQFFLSCHFPSYPVVKLSGDDNFSDLRNDDWLLNVDKTNRHDAKKPLNIRKNVVRLKFTRFKGHTHHQTAQALLFWSYWFVVVSRLPPSCDWKSCIPISSALS